MSKHAVSLHVEVVKKSIPDHVPDTDQSQNLTELSLTEVLSFYKIWLKSVNNCLRYRADSHTDRQTDRRQTGGIILPLQLRWQK